MRAFPSNTYDVTLRHAGWQSLGRHCWLNTGAYEDQM